MTRRATTWYHDGAAIYDKERRRARTLQNRNFVESEHDREADGAAVQAGRLAFLFDPTERNKIMRFCCVGGRKGS